MLRLHRATAFLAPTAALLAAATAAGAEPVVATCFDGSVVFAAEWADVHCAGAARMPPGHAARVASEPDRALALAFERETARERELEARIAEAVAPPLPGRGPAPGAACPPRPLASR